MLSEHTGSESQGTKTPKVFHLNPLPLLEEVGMGLLNHQPADFEDLMNCRRKATATLLNSLTP